MSERINKIFLKINTHLRAFDEYLKSESSGLRDVSGRIDKDDFKTITPKPKGVGRPAMLKIFVSYSRSDARDFAEAIQTHLTDLIILLLLI